MLKTNLMRLWCNPKNSELVVRISFFFWLMLVCYEVVEGKAWACCKLCVCKKCGMKVYMCHNRVELQVKSDYFFLGSLQAKATRF